MVSKIFSKIGLISLITFLFFLLKGCGYFEHDRTKELIEVIGKIKITKQENSLCKHLIFIESDEINAVIVDDCINIYFDSENNLIYTDSKLSETEKNYYKIKILNLNSNNISEAVKKEKISSQLFNLKTKGLLKI